MGTSSMILFQERSANKLIKYMVVYQQFDGYPVGGVGFKLIDFIQSKKMVNGYNKKYTQANGFGCLIAQYIALIKDGAGGLYIQPSDTVLDESDYHYIVTYDTGTGKFTIQMNDDKEMDFESFKIKCCANEEDDEEGDDQED